MFCSHRELGPAVGTPGTWISLAFGACQIHLKISGYLMRICGAAGTAGK